MQSTTFEINEVTKFKLTLPKGKILLGDVDSQYQSVGGCNKMVATIVDKVLKFEPATSLPFVDVHASLGFFSMIALTHGHQTIICEANPLFKDCILKSIGDNGISSTNVQQCSLFVSNQTVYEGKKTISLRELAPQGILFLRIGSCNDREDDIIDSAQIPDGFPVKYIMLEAQTVQNGRLNRKLVSTILKIIKEGYTLYEICKDGLECIGNFDKHMAQWLYNHKTGKYIGRSLLFAVHNTSTIDLTAS